MNMAQMADGIHALREHIMLRLSQSRRHSDSVLALNPRVSAKGGKPKVRSGSALLHARTCSRSCGTLCCKDIGVEYGFRGPASQAG